MGQPWTSFQEPQLQRSPGWGKVGWVGHERPAAPSRSDSRMPHPQGRGAGHRGEGRRMVFRVEGTERGGIRPQSSVICGLKYPCAQCRAVGPKGRPGLPSLRVKGLGPPRCICLVPWSSVSCRTVGDLQDVGPYRHSLLYSRPSFLPPGWRYLV